MRFRSTFPILLAAPLSCAQPPVTAVRVTVPATSNPYLAGMPRGTKARFNDRAPEQSPVLVGVSLRDVVALGFRAAGAVEHGPYQPPQFDPPAGGAAEGHQGGPEHGISDIYAPVNALVGLFLDDDRPDRTRAPKPFKLRANLVTVEPELKQIFYIGAGVAKGGARRRFLVPKGATRLFLGTMDGFEWSNNQGAFEVLVIIEHTDVSSTISSVGSSITFAKWACLPEKSQCTPDRAIVEEKGPGQYHIVLPAQLEWGVSIPNPAGAKPVASAATGTVCLDAESRSMSSCLGPQDGALAMKTEGGRTYFSVKDPSGAFQNHEGYFEFDVTIR